jgi:hypothetical protein
LASGAVGVQYTSRENDRLVNTTQLSNHTMAGYPRYQHTNLHREDGLHYKLHLEYLYRGEVVTHDGSKPTTVAQAWHDENLQLEA